MEKLKNPGFEFLVYIRTLILLSNENTMLDTSVIILFSPEDAFERHFRLDAHRSVKTSHG
jgi:hypothetical protein